MSFSSSDFFYQCRSYLFERKDLLLAPISLSSPKNFKWMTKTRSRFSDNRPKKSFFRRCKIFTLNLRFTLSSSNSMLYRTNLRSSNLGMLCHCGVVKPMTNLRLLIKKQEPYCDSEIPKQQICYPNLK